MIPCQNGVDGTYRCSRLNPHSSTLVKDLDPAEGATGVDHDSVGESLARQARPTGTERETDLVTACGSHGAGNVVGGGGAHQRPRHEQVVGGIGRHGGEAEQVCTDLSGPDHVLQLADEPIGQNGLLSTFHTSTLVGGACLGGWLQTVHGRDVEHRRSMGPEFMKRHERGGNVTGFVPCGCTTVHPHMV